MKSDGRGPWRKFSANQWLEWQIKFCTKTIAIIIVISTIGSGTFPFSNNCHSNRGIEACLRPKNLLNGAIKLGILPSWSRSLSILLSPTFLLHELVRVKIVYKMQLRRYPGSRMQLFFSQNLALNVLMKGVEIRPNCPLIMECYPDGSSPFISHG